MIIVKDVQDNVQRKGSEKMGNLAKGRKEIKHAISYPQYMMMKSKLAHIMQLDPHAGANGKYLIRSTYFDNFSNKVLNEKKKVIFTVINIVYVFIIKRQQLFI